MVVVVVVVVVEVVVVEVVVVVSGDVGSGIDSGPLPGLHAAMRTPTLTAAASDLVVAVSLLCTIPHSARWEVLELSETAGFGDFVAKPPQRRSQAGSVPVDGG